MVVIAVIAGLTMGIIVGLLAYHAHVKANPPPGPTTGPFASCPRCGDLISAHCAEHLKANLARGQS